MRSGLCVLVILLILVAVVVVSAVSHLLEGAKEGAIISNEAHDDVRSKCHRIARNGRSLFVHIFPLSAVRIVVVVLEIVTQVRIYML